MLNQPSDEQMHEGANIGQAWSNATKNDCAENCLHYLAEQPRMPFYYQMGSQHVYFGNPYEHQQHYFDAHSHPFHQMRHPQLH